MITKKAQQISIQFLVRFILAVVVFGLGVILMWNIFFDSSQIAGDVQGEFDKKIAALNCKPTETVCVASNKFDIPAGDSALVELKVNNNNPSALTYDITVQIRNSDNTLLVGEGFSAVDQINVFPLKYDDEEVQGKSSKDFPILIDTTKQLPPGLYVVRIQVQPSGGLPEIIKRIQFEVS